MNILIEHAFVDTVVFARKKGWAFVVCLFVCPCMCVFTPQHTLNCTFGVDAGSVVMSC